MADTNFENLKMQSSGKRWTTKEIFEDVVSVIEQLSEVW